jgi:hypothetical protein
VVLGALFIFVFPVLLVIIILLPVFLWLKNIGYNSFKSHILSGFLSALFAGVLFLLCVYGLTKELPVYYIGFLFLVSGYGCMITSLIWWFGIRKLNN